MSSILHFDRKTSDSFQISSFDGVGMIDIAGISRRGWLKEQHASQRSGCRFMYYSARHDTKFAFVQRHDSIAKMNVNMALQDQKELVLMLMMMPDIFAFEFNQLDRLAIELTHNLGNPHFAE